MLKFKKPLQERTVNRIQDTLIFIVIIVVFGISFYYIIN